MFSNSFLSSTQQNQEFMITPQRFKERQRARKEERLEDPDSWKNSGIFKYGMSYDLILTLSLKESPLF